MGNCLKSCFPQADTTKALRSLNILTTQSNGVDFTFLVEDNSSECNVAKRSCTSKDIQLQCLDARALLARTTTSTPASSLDLEWEHETLPISLNHDASGSSWVAVQEDFSHCDSSSQHNTAAQNSDSDWSRVSSANSLEWDNVNSSIQASPPVSEVDTDTQYLLSEIERLTKKTLLETGQDLFS